MEYRLALLILNVEIQRHLVHGLGRIQKANAHGHCRFVTFQHRFHMHPVQGNRWHIYQANMPIQPAVAVEIAQVRRNTFRIA